uniref:BTB domain-containing protein n=1 Tax=Acrobeloides nanus TaxID=290746 RepID=A0A914CAI7_9BILA
MLEVCMDNLNVGRYDCSSPPSSSNLERPFKLLVKNQVFTVDSEKMRRLSPIFGLMFENGRDFENGRELAREIVDEKSDDISTFLRCLYDHNQINETNFVTLLRLSNKYQVNSLEYACEEFIEKLDMNTIKPDQVLTLLIASNDHHLKRKVVAKLVLSLAKEDKNTFNRLKISRYLPSQLYGAIIGTNMNLLQVREITTMNGHLFKMERSKTQYRRGLCDMCRMICDAATCESCHKHLCKTHWTANPCQNDYGRRFLDELKKNPIELEYQD